jgi:hypothetical protein
MKERRYDNKNVELSGWSGSYSDLLPTLTDRSSL